MGGCFSGWKPPAGWPALCSWGKMVASSFVYTSLLFFSKDLGQCLSITVWTHEAQKRLCHSKMGKVEPNKLAHIRARNNQASSPEFSAVLPAALGGKVQTQ